MKKITASVMEALRNSPSGIASLDMLESLGLSDFNTLKTSLSRLSRSGRIVRLKRGVYAARPLTDAFAAAQATFDGYLGFSSALYIHRLIAEVPFTIIIVTPSKSKSKILEPYEFKAVSLKEKAIGFENVGNLVVSTRAKTLFDCVYLKRYSIERKKLIDAYAGKPLSAGDLNEFDSYVRRFIPKRKRMKFDEVREGVQARGE